MTIFKKISLPMQVMIALVLGVIVGLYSDVANYIKPFGDIFLNLIKMIVIPVVFCSLA